MNNNDGNNDGKDGNDGNNAMNNAPGSLRLRVINGQWSIQEDPRSQKHDPPSSSKLLANDHEAKMVCRAKKN